MHTHKEENVQTKALTHTGRACQFIPLIPVVEDVVSADGQVASQLGAGFGHGPAMTPVPLCLGCLEGVELQPDDGLTVGTAENQTEKPHRPPRHQSKNKTCVWIMCWTFRNQNICCLSNSVREQMWQAAIFLKTYSTMIQLDYLSHSLLVFIDCACIHVSYSQKIDPRRPKCW